MVQKESIKSTILTIISVTSRTITKTRSIIKINSLLAFSATYHRICVNQFLESMQHAKVLSPLEYSYAYRLMSIGLYYMCGKCLWTRFKALIRMLICELADFIHCKYVIEHVYQLELWLWSPYTTLVVTPHARTHMHISYTLGTRRLAILSIIDS